MVIAVVRRWCDNPQTFTPRLGLGCHVTFVNEPGVHYSDTSLPGQIDREIASITMSEVFHVCSCCCKTVTGRIVCWQSPSNYK